MMSNWSVTGPNYLTTIAIIAGCLAIIGHRFPNPLANMGYTMLAAVVAVFMTGYLWKFGMANDPIITVLLTIGLVMLAVWQIRRRFRNRNQPPPPPPNITINNNFPPS
jgi:energy-converting hydrogenase Eha subunit C